MITNIRENDDLMKKLERILGICTNTNDNIEKMIARYSSNFENYNEQELKEDLNLVSANLNTIMNFIDPIFRQYLVVPSTLENEDGIKNINFFFNVQKNTI